MHGKGFNKVGNKTLKINKTDGFCKDSGLKSVFGEVIAEIVNGLGLGEGGELEVQMFNLVQKFIRIPNVQISTNAPLLPNPCWWQ